MRGLPHCLIAVSLLTSVACSSPAAPPHSGAPDASSGTGDATPGDANPIDGGSLPSCDSWTLEAPYPDHNSGSSTTAVVDQAGVLHVGTAVPNPPTANFFAHLSRSPDGEWSKLVPTNFSIDASSVVSLAVDSDDQVVACFTTAYVKMWALASVFHEDVAVGDSFAGCSLVVDVGDTPRASYTSGTNYVAYSARTEEGWTSQNREIIDNVLDSSETTMGLDGTGTPHVAYYARDDDGGRLLRHAIRIGADSWQVETVGQSGYGIGTRPAMTLDDDGHVHVSFAGVDYDLRYAVRDLNGTWESEIVDDNTMSAFGSAIAVDDHNVVHIAYYKLGDRDLAYAHRGPGSSWKKQVIDANGDVGGYPGLAISGDGTVHIVYRDETNRTMKHALCNPSSQ